MKWSRIAVFLAGIGTAIAGSALAQYVPHQFTDIPQGSYVSDAVGKWWRRGVIKGYEDGRFGPDDPVTRAQMAIILDRFDTSVIDPLRQEIMQINRSLQRNMDPLPLSSPDEEPTSPEGPPSSSLSLGVSDLPSINTDTFCTQKKDDLNSLFEKFRSCQVDADCLLFVRACGPYVTCGKPVTKNVLATLERSVTFFEDVCTSAFPIACVACIDMDVRCTEGQCVSVNQGARPGERCTAYLREGEEEAYCAICGNSVCEPFERCTSSNCQNGTCTQDCGGLYCPGDCS